jgi:DnaJ-class molecular chaperone
LEGGEKMKCLDCKGEGFVHIEDIDVLVRECRTCEGTGEAILYVCDKELNTECTKEFCNVYCNHTFNKKYAKQPDSWDEIQAIIKALPEDDKRAIEERVKREIAELENKK